MQGGVFGDVFFCINPDNKRVGKEESDIKFTGFVAANLYYLLRLRPFLRPWVRH